MDLIPLATITAIAVGVVGVQKGIPWLFQRQQKALDHFWAMSNAMLIEVTDSDERYNSRIAIPSSTALFTEEAMVASTETQRCPSSFPATTSHIQRVHDLEIQPVLVYEELSVSRAQMRLLRVHAASDYDELIQCNLERFDLGTDTPYTALSYCWGDTTNPRTIVVDEQIVNVTQNLYLALRELRFVGAEYVWVDALCINQQDKVELQQQIQRMTLIYGRARTVFAWLGESDTCFDELRDTLNKLQSSSPLDHWHEGVLNRILTVWLQELGILKERQFTLQISKMAFPAIGKILKNSTPGLSDDDRTLHAKKLSFIAQLQHVLNGDYWRRAWILQELTVAGDIRLRCGQSELDFGLLSSVVQELEALHGSGIFEPFSPCHQHLFNVGLLRKKWRPREPIHLLSALRESYHAKSSKSHDKIYSLSSLCFDSSRFVTVVDYNPPMTDIIRRMTLNSIQATRTLDVICMQGRSRDESTSLPSWAPDWTSIGSHKFNTRMVQYLTGLDDHPRSDPRDKYWRATSESLCATAYLTEETLVLNVKGKSVGSVTKYGCTLEECTNSDAIEEYKPTDSHKNSVMRLFESSPARNQAQGIFRTLTVYKTRVRQDDDNFVFKELWDPSILIPLRKEQPLVYNWLQKHQHFVIHGKPLSWWSRGVLGRLDVDDKAFGKAQRFLYHATHDEGYSFKKRVKNLLAAFIRGLQDGLRFMETSGGMTGWAHPAVQQGDEIFLLEGCSIPVILRPLEGKEQQPAYEVIGDAFVFGVMSGQSWKGDQDLGDLYLY